jgi:superfamily II DNA/RNA helicase
MSFFLSGLSQKTSDHLLNIGFIEPTPIQKMGIPLVLANCDLMASAKTGTGKTGCFLIPLIDYLRVARKKNRMPRALILEPTRELALQVHEQFLKFYGETDLKAVVLVGGESNILQERSLAKGVDIVIATPGRLIDLYERQKIMLHDIKTFVIDEADRMLDMGFIPDIDRLSKILPPFRQTLLFSATFNEEIEKLGNSYLMNPKRLTADNVNETATTIEQYFITTQPRQKNNILLHLLTKHKEEQAIVFCNRKSDIIKLIKTLSLQNFNAIDLHGDLTQQQRNERLDQFRSDTYKVLVASDIAARGIDIPDLGVVINYDIPLQVQDYVHRIGRTGRANQKGIAYTIALNTEEKKIRAIEKFINQKIAPCNIELKEKPVKEKKVSTIEKFISKKITPCNIEPKENSAKEKKSKEASLSPLFGFGDFTPAFMLKNIQIIEHYEK